MKYPLLSLLYVLLGNVAVFSQNIPTNYNESAVPAYNLPNPLLSPEGNAVTTVKEWEQHQRPYILNLFTNHVYGKMPGKPAHMHFKVTESDAIALDGKAIRKQVTIYFTAAANGPHLNLLIYLPRMNKPVPVFAGLNFNGNHTIADDPAIQPPQYFRKKEPNMTDEEMLEKTRGSSSSRWPIAEIIARGYGVATAHYYDLEPDQPDGWEKGIRSSLKNDLRISPEAWSAIGAWAWGLSRIQDYLETDPDVAASRTALIGHSRLGKTALWAGANDPRFALVISNNSGEGGAALSKRIFGETIRNLNTTFPHWFIAGYKTYNDHPERLPVDQHMLLALIAPRPLYIASAEEDKWADPKGEFLAAKNASPVYTLYHLSGLTNKEMPVVNHPVGSVVRYHIRTGKHDVTLYDWQQYLKFADENNPY